MHQLTSQRSEGNGYHKVKEEFEEPQVNIVDYHTDARSQREFDTRTSHIKKKN